MILSASRRTDIPSYYAEWFYNRLRDGNVLVRNPMNENQISEIKLTPENVDCIVFWTKDPKPLFAYLNDIDAMSYKYYFQFTITPYGKEIEPDIRDKAEIVSTFKKLSERIGRERVILRYDPIFITEGGKYTREYHVRAFNKLCKQLSMYTERVVISFLDGYRKIAKNVAQLGIREPDHEDILFISEKFSHTAKSVGLELETCAEKIDLSRFGIKHSKCVDGDLIEKILGCQISSKDIRDGNRENCGCMKCIDIGQYDTCIHNCVYCYANLNKEKAMTNFKAHLPCSRIILGEVDQEKVIVRNERDTRSLKIIEDQMHF